MKGLADCGNATGINIFSVAEFPTLDQVETLSENVKCSNSFNQINQVANTEIQCNITIEGVSINFGGLISSFLSGKTGNESDSGSGSIQIQLDDSMGSSLDYFASKSNSTSASSSSGSTVASPSQVLTFIAYGIAIAVGMCL
ncbi:hypothetical protein CCR75_002792 [Bremia lactucae]|uniref:Elicitin n=1 Tax=Bremia lactucae TaxID=4779 RepID=A0A976IGL6_BRELC|nr:hypothetical protein CCR75_002792 [Bremia lactucae]